MMTDAVMRRARELAAEGTAFVTATVVRAQRPTSVKAGDVALVLGDGTIEGFVGGVCAQQSVRVYALKAIETEEALLLRIVPDGPVGEDPETGQEVRIEEGAVTANNPCLSGGAIEIFLEPVLPQPRVLVVGDTPIAAALLSLGAGLGLDVVRVDEGAPDPAPGDLAVVVAAHGRDELHTLRRGLEEGVPYIGLVASRKRGAGVIEELRTDGVTEEHLRQIDVPAGIDIRARTPAEIALSILATIVAVRRGEHVAAPEHLRVAATPSAPSAPGVSSSTSPLIAIDPICGMTVAAVADTPSVEYDGETVYFCCEGCKAKFQAQHEHALTAE
jgi:xanthine dehydrogenase accessory factor